MNIAIVSPWAISESAVGGTERFTIDLATQLLSLGNSVEVFTLSGKNCHIQGVKYTSLNLIGEEKVADEYDLKAFADDNKGDLFYAKWAKFLETKIDARNFDVIQLNSLLFIDAWPAKPRIFTIHTNPFEYRLDWGQERLSWVEQKIKRTLPATTLLVTPSDHYAKHFSKIFKRPVKAIPHAIDISRLRNDAAIGSIDSRSGSNESVTILLPSRLELIQKRPQIVFQGIALLPQRLRKRVTVVVSGKDSQYEDNCRKLERIASDSGFEARFLRFQSMSEAYALADIVALPSKSESFGYSALESLTLGLPTILNSLPTFKEIGEGNDNAYFFDGTSASFSQTLSELLDNLQYYQTSETWSRRYDIRRWGKAYEKLAGSIV
jgi:glycosyltransferase involved in cell wall biosynthesis